MHDAKTFYFVIIGMQLRALARQRLVNYLMITCYTFYTKFYTNGSHPCTPKQLYVAISTSLQISFDPRTRISIIQFCIIRSNVYTKRKYETKRSILVLYIWCCFVWYNRYMHLIIIYHKNIYQKLKCYAKICHKNMHTCNIIMHNIYNRSNSNLM